MGLFNKKKKSKSESTSVSTTPAWHQQILLDIANKAVSLGNQPYSAYTGQRVADFTPDQQKSFDMTRANSGVWQPNLNTADSMTAHSGSPFNQSEMMKYLSPYLGGVVDEIGRVGSRNLTESLLPGVNDTFTGSGQFGSSRHADFTNQAVRDVNESVMGQQRLALQSGFDSAQRGYFTGRDQEARAGSQMGQLGQLRSGLGYQDAQAMNAVGGQQQARNQALNDVGYQNFLEERDDPYKKASWQAQLVSGLPVTQTNTNKTTNTQKSSGGLLGDILGGIGMIGGLATGGGGIGQFFGGGQPSGESMFSAPIMGTAMNTGMMAARNAAQMGSQPSSPYSYYRPYKKGGLVHAPRRIKGASPFDGDEIARYNRIDNIDSIGPVDVSRPVRARIKGVKRGRPRKYATGGRVDDLIPMYGYFDEGLAEDENDPGLPMNFQVNNGQNQGQMPNNGDDQGNLMEIKQFIDSTFGNKNVGPRKPVALSADNILMSGNLPGRGENIRSSKDAYEAALKNLQGSTQPGKDWINMPLFVAGAKMLSSDGSFGDRVGQAGLAAAEVMQGQRRRDQDMAIGSNQAALDVAADSYRSSMKPPNFEDVYTPQGGKQKIYTSPDGQIYQVGGVNFPDAPAGFTRDQNGELHIDPEQLVAQATIKSAGRSGSNININTPQSKVESAADAAFGKGKGERYSEMIKQADAMSRGRQDLVTMRGMLENSDLPTGNLTGIKVGLGRLLESFGVDTDRVQGLLGNITDIETFNKIAGQETLRILADMKGASSDRDLKYVENQAANSNFTREGNAKMINVMLRTTANAQKISNLISDWEQRYGLGGRNEKGVSLDQGIDMIRNPDRYRSAEENKFFVDMHNGDTIDVRRITPEWVKKNAAQIPDVEMRAIYTAAPENVRKYFTDLIKQPTITTPPKGVRVFDPATGTFKER